MHIKVNDILAHEVGYETRLRISDEILKLEELELAEPINGEVAMVRAEDSVLAKGQIETVAALECHRCLRAFDFPVAVSFKGEFSFSPEEEQWPIERDNSLDLAPMIRQEILLAIPIKLLCRPDCPGLCLDCGKPLEDAHTHSKKVKG